MVQQLGDDPYTFMSEASKAEPRYARRAEGDTIRWAVLERPVGNPVGVWWTNDRDAVGFIPYDPGGSMYSVVSAAAANRVPAAVVFDTNTEPVSQARACRPVQRGGWADVPTTRSSL